MQKIAENTLHLLKCVLEYNYNGKRRSVNGWFKINI